VWTVTLADLRMRARQFVIAVIGATLVFAMALVMAGLSGSFHAETKRTVDAVGADYFVVPAGTGGPFSSPAAVPGQVVQLARKTAGVTAADPLVVLPAVMVVRCPTPRAGDIRELVGGGEEKIATIRPGEYFGELGPMLGLPRSATARAAQRSVLTAYSARDFRHRAGAQTRDQLKTV